MATKKSKDGNEPSFEESLERLETIIKEMEGGKLSLEKMMAHFEEGSELLKKCTGKLNEVERKIEKLVQHGDAFSTEPLELDEDDE